MESVDDALPSWPGLRPRAGGEVVLLLDDADPLADGHALLLHLVARALRQGHRVCCLAASAVPQAHYAAVLRKQGVERAQVEWAFAYLPLLPPLWDSAGPQQQAVSLSVLLQRAAAFFNQQPPGAKGGGRVLVLDDVSLLAGVLGSRAAVELVQACRALLLLQGSADPAVTGPSSLLVRAMDGGGDGGGSGEDAATVPLLPLLLRHADALVEVRPLASGYSRDVHGLITVRAAPGARHEVVNFRVVGDSGIRCDRISTTR